MKATFISQDDLILAKIAAGRLRDLADVEDIQEAAMTDADPDST